MPQTTWSAEQTQSPLTHVAPAGHFLPHTPQLASSSVRLLQVHQGLVPHRVISAAAGDSRMARAHAMSNLQQQQQQVTQQAVPRLTMLLLAGPAVRSKQPYYSAHAHTPLTLSVQRVALAIACVAGGARRALLATRAAVGLISLQVLAGPPGGSAAESFGCRADAVSVHTRGARRALLATSAAVGFVREQVLAGPPGVGAT